MLYQHVSQSRDNTFLASFWAIDITLGSLQSHKHLSFSSFEKRFRSNKILFCTRCSPAFLDQCHDFWNGKLRVILPSWHWFTRCTCSLIQRNHMSHLILQPLSTTSLWFFLLSLSPPCALFPLPLGVTFSQSESSSPSSSSSKSLEPQGLVGAAPDEASQWSSLVFQGVQI